MRYEGWKLVEGTSRRKYTDPARVIQVLLEEGYKAEDVQKPVEPKGLTDMTKLLGKKLFEELLASLVIKPEGKPTLVPESDKRPELNRVAEAKQDFDNKMDE